MVAIGNVKTRRRRGLGDAEHARELVRRYLAGERSFPGIRLRRVTLRNHDLRGIDLRGADLRGADLTGCLLGRAQLTGAKIGSAGTDRAIRILGIPVSLALSTASVLALDRELPAVPINAAPSLASSTVGVMLLVGITVGARHAKPGRAVLPVLAAAASSLLVAAIFAGSPWLRTALDVVPHALPFVLPVACFLSFWSWRPPAGIVFGSAEHNVVVATRTGRVVVPCVGVLTCWVLLAAQPPVASYTSVVVSAGLFAVAALAFGQALALLMIEFGIAVVIGSLQAVCVVAVILYIRYQPVAPFAAALLLLLADLMVYLGPVGVRRRRGAARWRAILGAATAFVAIAFAGANEPGIPTQHFLVAWAAIFCGVLMALVTWEGHPIGRLLVRPILSLRQRHCTQFVEAYLGSAKLDKTCLTAVRMARANLAAVTLEGQRMVGAMLREADLSRTLLREADLSWADLQEANLSEADLRGACLRGANLQGANLDDADFGGTDLRYADMRWARMNHTVMADAALDGALLPADVRWEDVRD